MPISFMRRPRADIDLQVTGENFSPGDEVGFRATITAAKGLNVRQARLSLQCIETYWVIVSTGKSTSEQKRTRTLAEVPYTFIRNSRIRRGLPHIEEGSLKLPEDAPLSAEGKVANIRWQLKLSIDVPGRRDLHSEQVFVVRSPFATNDDHRDEGASRVTVDERFGDCKLRLEVSQDRVNAGDSVPGRLRIDALQDCRFPEVRVELERREEAGSRKRSVTADQVVLEQDLELKANRSQEWGFQLTVPPGTWPSTEIRSTVVRWKVKGILARSMRRDFSAEYALQVD